MANEKTAVREDGLIPQSHGRGALVPPWEKGKARGRPPGIPNKTTRIIKEAILAAADAVGDFTREERTWTDKNDITRTHVHFERGPGELQGYLEHLAMHQPASFAGLLGRVIPTQVETKAILEDVAYHTHEEVTQELRRRGLPVEPILRMIERRDLKSEK